MNQMLLLREIQSRTGGFTEFVPLGFIHDNTLLFAQGLARAGATLEEHLEGARAGAGDAGRIDQSHPGFVGEAGSRGFATVPAGGR